MYFIFQYWLDNTVLDNTIFPLLYICIWSGQDLNRQLIILQVLSSSEVQVSTFILSFVSRMFIFYVISYLFFISSIFWNFSFHFFLIYLSSVQHVPYNYQQIA